jgi:CO dehydrogenase nickel-insertion accessory protein CooC1
MKLVVCRKGGSGKSTVSAMIAPQAASLLFQPSHVIEKLKADSMQVIVDMDAGIEHFGKGVAEGCDRVVAVIDPSYESVLLSEKISEMAARINKPVFFILNRMNEDVAELEAMVDNKKIAGSLLLDARSSRLA